MLLVTELARLVLQQKLKPGDWVVDATVGNGHDTRWLADRVGPSGSVFGFDIQEKALSTSRANLAGLSHVALFHDGHERLAEVLPEAARQRLAAVMFNLGYLPGAPKDTITRADTTIAALEQAAGYLRIGGIMTVVLYPGHTGGEAEAAAVRAHVGRLPTSLSATHCVRMNAAQAAPELILIERLR